jgi:hypothetical protein
MSGPDSNWTRRSMLLGLAGVVAAGAAAGATVAAWRKQAAPERPASLPDLPVYEPGGGEVLAGAKLVAGRAVQALGTHEVGRPSRALGPELLAAGADEGRIEQAAGRLRPQGGSSAAEIVYAQLGGLSGTRAAVMVVVRQHLLGGDGGISTVTRTVDVRLSRRAERWAVTELGSVGGMPAPRPANLPAAARAVLDDRRIELPDSARWDIHRGDVDERLLELMAAMARRAPYAVTVLKSGHPVQVFGTSRRSNHNKGRAVDVYRIGDRLVLSQRRGDTTALQVARWLAGSRPSEFGSPWDLDGRGGRSFTDTVHQDHIHIGFDA